jgi:hypothetical protein
LPYVRINLLTLSLFMFRVFLIDDKDSPFSSDDFIVR